MTCYEHNFNADELYYSRQPESIKYFPSCRGLETLQSQLGFLGLFPLLRLASVTLVWFMLGTNDC